MRLLVAGLFGVAVAAAILAGDGLVLVPHTHGPGTPAEHPHGLALYRFPIALLGEPPDAPQRSAERSTTTAFRLATPAAETILGVSLVLVAAVAVVGAMVPARRATRLSTVQSPVVSQWWTPTPTGPPRRALLPR